MAQDIQSNLYRDGLKLQNIKDKLGFLDTELGYSNTVLGDIESLTNKRKRIFMLTFTVVCFCMTFILLYRFYIKAKNSSP